MQLSSHSYLLFVAFAGLACVGLLLFALRQVVRTTLIAPCLWAVLSGVCITTLGLFHFESQAGSSAPWRFVVAVSAFCPLMAVLGAKRPQHVGWQWVVVSLWLVLAWPAGQAMLAGSGLELFIAWKLFLVGLIVVGLLNYLPTGHWASCLLVAIGQVALLAEFLLPQSDVDPGKMLLVALALFLVAALLSCATFFRKRQTGHSSESPREKLAEFEQRWFRFRDAYGAFWALRILGRVNETAGLKNWPMRLEWHGFVEVEGDRPTEAQLQEVEQCFETQLRRFW